jgi:hypothetical protein
LQALHPRQFTRAAVPACAAILVALVILACTPFRGISSPEAESDAGDANVASDASAADAGPGDLLCTAGCPVLALDFDDADGVLAADRSPFMNHGSVIRGVHANGVRGTALTFPPGPPFAQVLVPSSPSLDIGGTSLTIAFFIFLNETLTTRDQIVLQKPWTEGRLEPPYSQFAVEYHLPAKALTLYLGAEAGQQLTAAVVPPLARWVHVAFVLSGATVTGYLQGAVAGTASMPVPVTKRGTAIRFGTSTLDDEPFLGMLDSVRIYDRSLSPDEVKALSSH